MSIVKTRAVAALSLAAALALGACGVSGGASAPTSPPAEAPTAAPIAPPAATEAPTATLTASPTALPTPTTAPTTAPTSAPATPESPVYVDGGAVIARTGLDDMAQLGSAPAGVHGAALLDDGALLVLRESGVERVSLPGGESQQVAALDRPAIYGSFRELRDGSVLYAAIVSEPESVAPFGMGTRIGVYDPASGAARQIVSAPQNLELLGVTGDGAALLVLPRGQDPAFGIIQARSLSDGALVEELQVPGEGFARVSPDGRWAAASSRRVIDDQTSADELLLYDLTARPVTSQVVALPQGGAASGGVWAPDSSRFYFTYGAGNVSMLEGSYGLWGLDPATLEVAQVADVEVVGWQVAGISPGGSVLLRSETSDQAVLVGTPSGAVTPSVLPPSALLAGWQ